MRNRLCTAFSILRAMALLALLLGSGSPLLAESPQQGTEAISSLDPPKGWHWQRGGSFLALDFPAAGQGWLGGELLVHGVKGPDGAWSWHQQAPAITEHRRIKELDFFDANHGWALGSDDTLL